MSPYFEDLYPYCQYSLLKSLHLLFHAISQFLLSVPKPVLS